MSANGNYARNASPEQLGHIAATQLADAASRERNLTRAEHLRACAQQLESASPHQLRHSLARRMLNTGAQGRAHAEQGRSGP